VTWPPYPRYDLSSEISTIRLPFLTSANAALIALVNFAAETHVDRSIEDASPFLRTNVCGAQCWLEGPPAPANFPRFVHISTDEVYGRSAPAAGQLQ